MEMYSTNSAARARTVNTSSQALAQSAPRLEESGPSVISPGVELVGSITTSDELHIRGAVDGNVRASSLVICKGGMVKGEVHAENIVIHGSVEGVIHGMSVQLLAGASVRADIVHTSLEIDPTAMFEGASKRIPPPVSLKAEDASMTRPSRF